MSPRYIRKLYVYGYTGFDTKTHRLQLKNAPLFLFFVFFWFLTELESVQPCAPLVFRCDLFLKKTDLLSLRSVPRL